MAYNDTLCKYDMPPANSVDTDYKGEVIAAGIIENGLDAEQIYMSRLGSDARGYSKDIEYLRILFSHRSQTQYLEIYTNRSGFYDLLPEGIFHRIKRSQLNKTKEELIREIKNLQKEEEKVRLLFCPFERSIDNALINAQLYERQLDKKYTNRNFSNIFSRLWPILNVLQLHKAMLLVEIIPLISKIECNSEIISGVMSNLLDMSVAVEESEKKIFLADNLTVPRLGGMRLGINAVIGKSFSSGYYSIDVKLGPMTDEQIVYYRTNKDGKQIIKYLTDLLFPADREILLKFQIEEGCKECIISKNKTKSSRLGINSYL